MKMHLRVHFKEPLKMHKNVPKGTHLTLHVDGALWHCIDGALKCAFVSTIEDATESLSESTPKGVLWGLFEDAKQGAFELHLKMCVVVHLLGHMSAQNDSIERWTWGSTLCCSWEHI